MTIDLAGMDLRAAVAFEVMGYPDGSVFAPNNPKSAMDFKRGALESIAVGRAYERDLDAAFIAYDDIIGLAMVLSHHRELPTGYHRWQCRLEGCGNYNAGKESHEALGDSAPEAICRALLVAVRAREGARA